METMIKKFICASVLLSLSACVLGPKNNVIDPPINPADCNVSVPAEAEGLESRWLRKAERVIKLHRINKLLISTFILDLGYAISYDPIVVFMNSLNRSRETAKGFYEVCLYI